MFPSGINEMPTEGQMCTIKYKENAESTWREKKGCTQDKESLESTMNNKNGNVTSCSTDLEYRAVSF